MNCVHGENALRCRICAGAAPASDPPPPASERCCRLWGVGHTMYKVKYLPSIDEYVLHGYPRDRYEHAMAEWKKSIDETGRL